MVMEGNNIYKSGVFSRHGTRLGSFVLDSALGYNFFARCDTNGNYLWYKQYKGYQYQLKYAKNNRLYFIGGSRDHHVFAFDSLLPAIPYLPNVDSMSGFVLQTDTVGNIKAYSMVWGLSNIDNLNVDANGNVYISGYLYQKNLIIGQDTIYPSKKNTENGFVAKFDSNGVCQWTKSVQADNWVYWGKMAIDKAGDIYVSGGVTGVANIDGFALNGTSSEFLAKLSGKDGKCIELKQLDGIRIHQMEIDTADNLIVSGTIGDPNNNTTATFGDMTVKCSRDSSYFFVGKIYPFAAGSECTGKDYLLTIYPNPSQHQFNITVPDCLRKYAPLQLQVYDNLGAVVYSEQVNTSPSYVSVDLGTLQRGIYFVSLGYGKEKYSGKIILK